MNSPTDIDISFDFRSDTPAGKDPDQYSRTLRDYHKLLWTKPLPNGMKFDLHDTTRSVYLHHKSTLGEFFLASDGAITTFWREASLAAILAQVPAEEREEFQRVCYTIGGMMLFPGNKIGRKMTINGARGFHPRIKDRFDLTVECIRRHYRDENSPLRDALARYSDFFALFGSFQGYVQHFLLQDLVTRACSAVRFFADFENFTTSPVPRTLDAYVAYRRRATEFVVARNRRIGARNEGVVNLAAG